MTLLVAGVAHASPVIRTEHFPRQDLPRGEGRATCWYTIGCSVCRAAPAGRDGLRLDDLVAAFDQLVEFPVRPPASGWSAQPG